MDFSVMTFNLRTNVASDGSNAWPFRTERAAAMVARTGALVVGIQEGLHGMVTDLAAGLPDYAWTGEGRQGGTNDEFCAIFYRRDALVMEEHGNFALSETPERLGSIDWESACPRMCTWALFRFAAGPAKRFLVFNTHLDHRSQEAREKGIALVWRRLREKRRQVGAPAILMGDLNARPDNPVIRFLRGEEPLGGETAKLQDAFLAAPESEGGDGATFHAFTGRTDGAPIDFIFGTDGVTFIRTCVDRSQIDGAYPSDHFPVVARVVLWAGEGVTV